MQLGDNQLGRELRKLRKAEGLTIGKVASNLASHYSKGVLYKDASSISRLESGGRKPARTNLLRLLIGGYGIRDVPEIDHVLALAAYSPLKFGEIDSYLPQEETLGGSARPSAKSTAQSGQTLAEAKLFFSAEVEENILEVARCFKLDGESLLEDVHARTREAGRRRHLVQFREAAHKIRELKLDKQVLDGYYKDSALVAKGFHRYVVRGSDFLAATNIVAEPHTLGLNIDLKKACCSLKAPLFAPPTIRKDEIADLFADSLLMDVKASNDPVYCLQQFDPRNDAEFMSLSLSNYFTFRLTYGALEHEMQGALIATNFSPERALDRLPKRNGLLRDASELSNYRRRMCVGGVNVLFALRRRDDFVFFVGQRSSKVHTAPGVQCLIPTGFHQPLISAAEEVSPAHSVFRELWEEAFKGDEVISCDLHPKSDWYFKYPQLGWFREPKRKFWIEIVGFGINLKDGSFQLGVLFAVDDADYWTRFGDDICGNYEYIHRGDKAMPVSTKDPDAIRALLGSPLCANSSIFAVVEALQRLKRIDRKRVKLPEINLSTDV